MVVVTDDLLPRSKGRTRTQRTAPAATTDVAPSRDVVEPTRPTTTPPTTPTRSITPTIAPPVPPTPTPMTTSPGPTAQPAAAPALSRTSAVRPRRARFVREIVFGVVLALAAGIGLTWWATSSREAKPTFVGLASSTVPAVVGASGPQTPAQRVLTTTYVALHRVYTIGHSYRGVSLPVLARLLPGISIMAGDAASTNDHVVSFLPASADRVFLAARDDAGCSWVRDLGAGPQVVRHSDVVISCSAAAAPTSGWTAIATDR